MFVLALFSLDLIHYSVVSGSVLASNYTYISTSTTFENAKTQCENQSKRLASLDAPEEWDALIKFIHESNNRNDFWIALKRNTTTGWYNWLDGKELGFVNFHDDIDLDIGKNKCIVIEYDYLQWKTSYCTAKHITICYRPDKQYYIIDNNKREFDAAALACQQDGGHLPILKSITDYTVFEYNISSLLSDYAWLGLTASGDYYQWMNGEPLEKYVWESNDHKGLYVHAHPHDEDNALIQFHAPNESGSVEEKPYICQSPTPMTSVKMWVHYRYVLLSKNAVVYIPPRQQLKVSHLTDCAMQCSRDVGCYRYSLDGRHCKTYGRSYYSKDYNGGGVKLYDRVEVRTPLA